METRVAITNFHSTSMSIVSEITQQRELYINQYDWFRQSRIFIINLLINATSKYKHNKVLKGTSILSSNAYVNTILKAIVFTVVECERGIKIFLNNIVAVTSHCYGASLEKHTAVLSISHVYSHSCINFNIETLTTMRRKLSLYIPILRTIFSLIERENLLFIIYTLEVWWLIYNTLKKNPCSRRQYKASFTSKQISDDELRAK